MLRSLKANNSGVVLLMVLMATIVMMVFSIGVISRGVSQSVSSESEVDRIKAEQLAIGAYWKTHADLHSGIPITSTINATLDNKDFSAIVTPGSDGSGPQGTKSYQIQVTY